VLVMYSGGVADCEVGDGVVVVLSWGVCADYVNLDVSGTVLQTQPRRRPLRLLLYRIVSSNSLYLTTAITMNWWLCACAMKFSYTCDLCQ
jgi:hypothetical protein